MNTPPRMPTLYIPHGAGPCFFMDWNPADAWDKTAAYLRSIASSLPTRPQAIVLVTAHWLGAQPCMSSAARPGMLFDYYGFPPHTYELSYPAPGAPAPRSARVGSTRAASRRPVCTSTESVMSSRRKSGAAASGDSLTSTEPRWASTAGAMVSTRAANG